MEIKVGTVRLPNTPLTNHQLLAAAKKLKIPLRGVYLRNTLPKNPKLTECGILNLDTLAGQGTHWVCWDTRSGITQYFDSFGVQPPIEITNYARSHVSYNTEQVQPRDQVFCGHLCLYVLSEIQKHGDLQRVVSLLY